MAMASGILIVVGVALTLISGFIVAVHPRYGWVSLLATIGAMIAMVSACVIATLGAR